VRFCFPTTFYPPDSFGGDGIAVQRLAVALVKRGHEVTVVHDADAFVTLNGGEPGRAAENHGVEVITLRSGLGALSPMLTHQTGRPVLNEREIRRIFADGKFDVINYHNVSLIGGPRLFEIGRSATKIYTAHEHWLVCPTHVLWRNNSEVCTTRTCVTCQIVYRRPPQLWRFNGSFARSLSHIQLFIALSNFSRDKHYELGFPREMEVLPQFAPELSDEGETPISVRPHERPYFLVAGRLEKNKGVREAIEAFSDYDKADLLIAGSGSEDASLRRAARNNPRCIFLGQLDALELRRYFKNAIATIVPSLGFETFGMTIIESLREGTPVIARRIGPFPETIQRSGGGELFSTNDELVRAMHTLQENPAHAQMLGARGYEAFKELWSEPTVIRRYLELVEAARHMPSSASLAAV
jgi:Glycosyltransferase